MPQKMYMINLPEFAEYVYFVMSTTPQEILIKLNSKELFYFKDKKIMRRFADNETLEKRLLLLAKLEVPFCVVVGKRKNVDNVLDEIYTQYKFIEKRKALIDAMARSKVFVVSSNEVLLGLHMAAQNSHSKVYVLNYDYVKLNQKFLETGINTVNQDANNARNAFDILSRASLFTTMKIKQAPQLCGVSEFELKILLAIFPYRNTFVNVNKLYEILDMDIRQRGLKKSCTQMENEGYLRVLPGLDEQSNRLKTYTIAEKGIDTAMTFMKYIANNSLYGS